MKFDSSRRTATVIRPPSGVNLMALESRLLRICCTRAWSWCIGGKSGSTSALQVDVLPLGQRPGHVALGGDHLVDAELGQPRLHLAALDLRQVEDVVDHLQQRRPDFWMFCT